MVLNIGIIKTNHKPNRLNIFLIKPTTNPRKAKYVDKIKIINIIIIVNIKESFGFELSIMENNQ